MTFDASYANAVKAGLMAGSDTQPTPMIVGQAKSLYSNEIDETKKSYYVSDGVCGFAWIIVKPGTSRFARWLKKMGYARPDSYYGGVSIWISEYNQSMARKEAHAAAMAKALKDDFPELTIRSMSRMD